MKVVIDRILNLALYLIFCAMLGTGLLIAYKLPPRVRGGGGRLTVLDLNRHEWGDIHLWMSYAFVFLVVAHLAMNWKWLVKVAVRLRMWKLVLGLAVGVLLVGGVLLLPVK